jgi:protein spaetzle
LSGDRQKFPANRNANRKSSISLLNSSRECGDTFCTADPNYPAEFISSLNLEKFEHLFGDDFIENFSVRFNDDDESGLCQSRKRLIHPKKGQTVQNTWLTIVNDDNKYRQGVLIEECL